MQTEPVESQTSHGHDDDNNTDENESYEPSGNDLSHNSDDDNTDWDDTDNDDFDSDENDSDGTNYDDDDDPIPTQVMFDDETLPLNPQPVTVQAPLIAPATKRQEIAFKKRKQGAEDAKLKNSMIKWLKNSNKTDQKTQAETSTANNAANNEIKRPSKMEEVNKFVEQQNDPNTLSEF